MGKSEGIFQLYDIVIVADIRFPSAMSIEIAEEIAAQARAGFRTGLVQIKAPALKHPHPIHSKIRACIDQGMADILDPDSKIETKLSVIHHPILFASLPNRPLRISSNIVLLIVHQPPFNGYGEENYDARRIDQNVREIFGNEVIWTPVSPIVRQQLNTASELQVSGHDWYNIIDSSQWTRPRRYFNALRPIIGRHSCPDPLKWPDNRELTLSVYPQDEHFAVHVLGGGPFLQDHLGALPPNWKIWPFGAKSVKDFLYAVDFYVYYHHSSWIEAFGRNVLEALASGALAILPPSFEPLFGEAALYAKPEDVRSIVQSLHQDWNRFEDQSNCGRIAAQEIFAPKIHVKRVTQLIGRPNTCHVAKPVMSSSKKVIFMTSNDIGMGHLSRTLAIAKRCSDRLVPIFVTMSQAYSVVHQYGFPAEYLPFYSYLRCERDRWNDFLQQELSEILEFYRPSVLIFDGHVPHEGLIAAIKDHPDVIFLWCRQAMWQPDQDKHLIGREKHFCGVIEPGELAAGRDRGPTTRHRELTRSLAPIRLLQREELLPRTAARRELGLSNDRPAALLQFGSGNNAEYQDVQDTAIQHLAKRGIQIIVADWPDSEQDLKLSKKARRIQTFPIAQYLNAFDLAISEAGYSAFHELVFSSIPSIFVPNESSQQDDQLGRAQFADWHGLGICVRKRSVYELNTSIDRLLDIEETQIIVEQCQKLDHENGATRAAQLIEELAFMRRTDFVQ